ncbi:hypothetical protein [Shouchella shacheensis]|uniref:hypothetical protein n=1 Tax=Shouchella shacheensis TaxID=1649580 RepID=UPI00073FCF24|nr:hypothetical protein [Shouchella shacheensis]
MMTTATCDAVQEEFIELVDHLYLASLDLRMAELIHRSIDELDEAGLDQWRGYLHEAMRDATVHLQEGMERVDGLRVAVYRARKAGSCCQREEDIYGIHPACQHQEN